MQKIDSLKALLDELPFCSAKDYVKLSEQMEIDPNDFKSYWFWSEEGYTRNCVARNENYELILLCWEEGQGTPIHGHNDQECWVYAVQGEFLERRYEMDDDGNLHFAEESVFTQGNKSYMNDEMGYHELINNTKGRAMSLHLYVSPIEHCEIYDPEAECMINKELFYDSIQGVLLQSATAE
ncbi:cysteine dioxygenase [bacterium]|nr:cysteine dioxygenase [bacterium]